MLFQSQLNAKYPHDHATCCYQLIVEGSLLEGLSEGKHFTFQGDHFLCTPADSTLLHCEEEQGTGRTRTRKPWKDSDDVKVFKLLNYAGF